MKTMETFTFQNKARAVIFVRILTVFVFSSLTAYAAPQNATPLPKSLAGASVSSDRLRKVVADSELKLGVVSPWQKKIFDEEVLSQPQRFVRDYRASAKGIDADVDWGSIKNYLSFHSSRVIKTAPTKSVTQPPLWYWIGAERGCLKCAQALPGIKKIIKSRVENRGFRALDGTANSSVKASESLSDDEGDTDSLSDAASENQKLMALQIKTKKVFEIPGRSAREIGLKENSEHWFGLKGAVGTLFVYLQLAPQDDVDSAHADEKRYLTLMYFGTSPEQANGTFGFSSEFESLENDGLDQSVVRLYLDAMTELGVQMGKQSSSGKASSQNSDPALSRQGGEVGSTFQLKISSVQSYGHYYRAKTEIQAALQDLSLQIVEREFSRGQALWILRAPETASADANMIEEVKKRVGGIPREKLKVSSIQNSENGISVVLAR